MQNVGLPTFSTHGLVRFGRHLKGDAQELFIARLHFVLQHPQQRSVLTEDQFLLFLQGQAVFGCLDDGFHVLRIYKNSGIGSHASRRKDLRKQGSGEADQITTYV